MLLIKSATFQLNELHGKKKWTCTCHATVMALTNKFLSAIIKGDTLKWVQAMTRTNPPRIPDFKFEASPLSGFCCSHINQYTQK